MTGDQLERRRQYDRDRYKNNPEVRKKQLARQAAWRAKRRAEDPAFLAADRKQRADYFRQKYNTDPDFRDKHRSLVAEHQWLSRVWFR